MRYFGGKYAIKKDLWEILNKETKGRVFIDLFCGVCNVVEGITTANQRIANDNNPTIQKSKNPISRKSTAEILQKVV